MAVLDHLIGTPHSSEQVATSAQPESSQQEARECVVGVKQLEPIAAECQMLYPLNVSEEPRAPVGNRARSKAPKRLHVVSAAPSAALVFPVSPLDLDAVGRLAHVKLQEAVPVRLSLAQGTTLLHPLHRDLQLRKPWLLNQIALSNARIASASCVIVHQPLFHTCATHSYSHGQLSATRHVSDKDVKPRRTSSASCSSTKLSLAYDADGIDSITVAWRRVREGTPELDFLREKDGIPR